MNFLLAIVLFTNVVIHIVVGPISNPSHNNDNEDSQISKDLLGRQRSHSDGELSIYRKGNGVNHNHKLGNKNFQSSVSGKQWNEYGKNPTLKQVRRTIHTHKPCFTNNYKGFVLGHYLSKSSFSNKLFMRIWSGFDYTNFHINNYFFFKEKIIDHINLIRRYHKVGKLRENLELNILAQEHANQMAKKHAIFYKVSRDYGMMVRSSYYPAASVMVSNWYDERHKYSFFSSSPKLGTQDFTQMVWKSTFLVGIGIARDCDLLYAALYFFPKGNVLSQYKKNVFRKKFKFFERK
uniref:CAP domain-containing protein (inferred by orthology to a zebrafish protein) n=1 Tax=Strongyloides venezuelensis TaxID=75913 RepID=A0A0K0G1Z2_STRVS